MSYVLIKNNSQSGFSLLEVVVAVAVMATALVVMLGAVNRNLDLASRSKNFQIASNLAQSVLSQIEIEGYPDITEESGQFEDYPGFDWYLTVFPYNFSQLQTEIRIVRLLIVWDDGNEDFEVWMAVSNT